MGDREKSREIERNRAGGGVETGGKARCSLFSFYSPDEWSDVAGREVLDAPGFPNSVFPFLSPADLTPSIARVYPWAAHPPPPSTLDRSRPCAGLATTRPLARPGFSPYSEIQSAHSLLWGLGDTDAHAVTCRCVCVCVCGGGGGVCLSHDEMAFQPVGCLTRLLPGTG